MRDDQRLFGVGLAVGLVAGLLAASILAPRVAGNEVMESLRVTLNRLLGRGERVRFDVLLQ